MNTQKTPLVQKLILLMLVLIFGAVVLLLINGRKQIEALRAGNGQEVSIPADTNKPDVDRAFPTLRSAKPHRTKVIDSQHAAKTSPPPQPTAKVAPSPVSEQPPTILPAGTVIEPPEALSGEHGISGRVTLIGNPPAEIPIRFDPTCGKLHPTSATTRRFVVSQDGGLADVFVYVSKGLEGKRFDTSVGTVLIDQSNCMYQPYIVGAMINQPIQIKNSDPVMHNIHALPRISDEFNFAQPLQGQTDERTFAKPELFIKMKCDVHDWMLCYVSVLSHPYFAVTDTNGFFELPSGLPPGKYEITAAHLKSGATSKTILLKKNNSVRLDFRLPVNGKPWRGLQAP